MTFSERTALGSRILILGCPGSGKSTLAEALSARTALPLFHLDNLWWKSDRTHISRDEFDAQLEKILFGPRWILDGDYSRTYEVRIQACDTVLFLDYDEDTCMSGILARVGKQRPDIPWVEEQVDSELVEEVRRYREKNRPAVYALLSRYSEKQRLIFENRDQADAWLSAL